MQQPPVYSDREQTPAQRQGLINMGRAWSVAQGGTPGPEAEALYARYVAGELTLQDVTDELVSYYQQRGTTPTPLATAISQQREMQPERLELA